MKVDFEDISSVKKKIKVVVPANTVTKEIEKAYDSLKKKAKVKGFRPGKVPKDILIQRFKEEVEADVTEKIFKDTYPEAIKEMGIEPITYPDVDTKGAKTGKDFSYSATVEVLPEITVTGFKGMGVEKEIVSLDQKDVDTVLKNFAESHATLETEAKERAIQSGDIAVIDFEAFIGDEPVDGGKAENYPLEIGAGRFPEKFEKKLIGKMPKDSVTIDVDFPDDYPTESFKGKRVKFEVAINEIKVKKLPNIDDEFAKDVGDFKDLKDLRDSIMKDLEEREKTRVEMDFNEMILKKLIELNPFEVPDALVDQRSIDIIRDTEMRLRGQGLSLESIGADPKSMMGRVRPQAEFDVKSNFILGEIARSENIEATKEEAEQRLKKDSEAAGVKYKEIKERYDKQQAWGDLIARMRREKTLDFLGKIVKIKEVKKKMGKDAKG